MKQSKLTGAISLTVAQGVVLMLGYVTHLWIGRALGPAPYGVYGIVLSLQTIVGLFLTHGVPSAISRFVAQSEEHAQSILAQAIKIQAVLAIALALTTAAASPLIAYLLNDMDLVGYILFIALVIFLQAFYPIYVQFFSGMHFFNKQAALTTLYAIAKLGGAITLLYFFGVYGALAGFAIGGIVAAIIGWKWTKKVGGKTQTKLPLKKFLSFAGTYVLILVGLQILMSLDLFMVKSMLQNDADAGYYNAAVTLSRISFFLLQALTFIMLPSVSALTKPGADAKKAASFISDTLRYLIILIIPSVTLAAATSKELIILFYTETFIPAAPVLTILIIGIGSIAFYLVLASIIAGAGKGKIGTAITFGLIILSAVLGSFLIPKYGMMGAAWQTTITGIIGLVILSGYTFRTFSIPLPIRSTINVIIATAIAVAPTYLWKASPILLPLQLIFLLGVYVVALFILREITTADRKLAASIHPKLSWIAK